jgi:transposase
MQIAVLGIDLGKNSCSVVGLDASGRVVLRRRLHRDGVIRLAAGLPRCVMAMEACCGAHHLGRRLRDQGHEVRLMSPEYVRPYVKAQKNDDRDAEAIAEAATRPTMRFVELKSEEQLDMQSLHRARDRLVGERTALINQLRAFLLERGIIVPQGRRKLELHLDALLTADQVSLSARTRLLIEDQRAEWRELDRRIQAFDEEFALQARTDEAARLLTTIPGIGPLNATALVAAVGKGRDLRAWPGPGRLAGVGAEAGDHGRQAEAARDQQAGQPVPAQDADPRRSRSPADAVQERDAARWVAAWPARAGAREHRGGGPRRQAGADHPRGAPQRAAVRDAGRGGVVAHGIGRMRPLGAGGRRGLRAVEARWPDSRPAFRSPVTRSGARRRRCYEDRDARISILARAVP